VTNVNLRRAALAARDIRQERDPFAVPLRAGSSLRLKIGSAQDDKPLFKSTSANAISLELVTIESRDD
jgi:hypothetical protein